MEPRNKKDVISLDKKDHKYRSRRERTFVSVERAAPLFVQKSKPNGRVHVAARALNQPKKLSIAHKAKNKATTRGGRRRLAHQQLIRYTRPERHRMIIF